MLFWTVIALAALAAALWIARPFLTRGRIEVNDAEGALSVFRDQMDEVDRDFADGQITEAERDAAQREIEQRALKAARGVGDGLLVSRRSIGGAAGLTAASVAMAVGVYAWLGAPDSRDAPLAARKSEVLQQRAEAGDTQARIALQIEKTKANPESFEDWWELAVAYSKLGDHASAVDAFRMAAELGGDKPGVLSAYAESMVQANGNKVPQASRVIFEQVLRDGPDARAMYYLALAKAQEQDFRGALEAWAALAADSRRDAPWMPLLRRDMVNMARILKADLTDYLPDATPQEIAAAKGEAVPQTPSRAEALEQALANDPMQYRVWIDLVTLRAEAGETEAALEALAQARSHFAAAPFVLQKFNETAQSLGLDLAAPRGPTSEDIAAAADLTDAERGDMIEGMVAGLAARLEDNPDNPEGWIMLVRSYATLGRDDKASASYDRALAHFAGNAAVLARLRSEAGVMVTRN